MIDPLEKSNLSQAEYFKDIVGIIYDPLVVLDAGLWELGILKDVAQFRQTALELEEQVRGYRGRVGGGTGCKRAGVQ
jgi:hypothetical protein